ncbi:hypothetical protein ACFU8T_11790 [Sphingobacterium spiritivorum]|uniref:hypothetical protein n=1 Tax=Sphingobacterium spiritivorum TaxID=258 RepID=UPI0036AC1539
MKNRFLILIISIIYPLISSAQIFDDTQAPPGIKWEQINTKDFQLIFPHEFHKQASTLSHQLTRIIHRVGQDFKRKPRKISFIIQTNTLDQNGYVQLAPRKSELYATPSGIASNQSWLDNLALHESRHVLQFDNLTGSFRAPLFEQLGLALYGLHLPSWYFEGDAVYTETVLSEGGRGRLPSWEMPIRTNILEGKKYSYEKYTLGSFKDIVPSYYTIGYFMATKMKNDFGEDIQQKILTDIRHHLLRPYSFNKALKKHTNMTGSRLFKSTIKELGDYWKNQENQIQPTSYTHLKTQKSRYPQHWMLPQIDQNGQLYSLYQSPQNVSQIVQIDTLSGSQKTILNLGIQLMPYFDLKGNLLVWDEYRRDARYVKRSYNVINIHNLNTKKTKTLTTKTRYYTPALSYSGDQIVCIDVNMTNEATLVILDSETGQVMETVASPHHIHLQQPQFDASGDKIVMIGVSEKGTCLVEYSLKDNNWSELTDWDNQQLERPVYSQNDVIFKAHYNGTDNIYRYTRSDKQISALTNARFGAFSPFVDSKTNQLFFNDYAVDGYKLAQISLNSVQAKDIRQTPDRFIHYYKPSLAGIPAHEALYDTTAFEIKPYTGIKRTVNFHSLTISSTDFSSFDNYKPGIFWISNNLLNTTKISLGYEYDTDLDKGIYSAQIQYQKYFPKFTVRYENKGQIGRASFINKPDSSVSFDWQEHLITAQMSLPWTIYRHNQVYSFGFNIATYYQNRYNPSLQNIPNFRRELKFPLSYQAYFNRNAMQSRMDLAPKWGQNFSVTYRHSPFEGAVSGTLLSFRSNFYLPGLVSNHGFQVRFGAQKASNIYQYSMDIPVVSGYGFFNSPRVTNTLLFNYRFPIAYPDWTIGGLAYIKRFKGGFFADYQNVHNSSVAPKTFGLNLSADVNFLRYVLPDFDCGVKFTYINDPTARQKVVTAFSLGYTY